MAHMAAEQYTGYCGRHAVTHTITVSIGSNAPDATRRVLLGATVLGLVVRVEAASMVYVTPDIRERGVFSPPLLRRRLYANAVLVVLLPQPPLLAASPEGFTRLLKTLEWEQGRLPEHRSTGIVNLDLDPVVWCGHIVRPADFMRPYYQPWAAMI